MTGVGVGLEHINIRKFAADMASPQSAYQACSCCPSLTSQLQGIMLTVSVAGQIPRIDGVGKGGGVEMAA